MFETDPRSRIPIYEQLKNQITEMIRLGVYNADEQLPSIRSVAAQAGLNVNTVKRAFLDLESDGVIYTVVGRGSFVCENALEGSRMRERVLRELRETIQSARSKGIGSDELISLINDVYCGGNQSD